MNRFIQVIVLLLFHVAVFAQKEYFIYLQSDGGQRFFVRMGDQTFTSSPAGHLILSKLRDSVYQFRVGFPEHKWPDQQFNIRLAAKDRGYLLKNFGEKGWGLFDLQTMDVQMAEGNAAARKQNGGGVMQVSMFTEVLAKAANDPSLREKPVYVSLRNEQQPDSRSKGTLAREQKPVGQVVDTSQVKTQPVATVTKKDDRPADIPLQKNDSIKSELIAKNERIDSVMEEPVPTGRSKPDSTTISSPLANQPVPDSSVITKAEKKESAAVQDLAKNETQPPPGQTQPVVKDSHDTAAQLTAHTEPVANPGKASGNNADNDTPAAKEKIAEGIGTDYVRSVVIKKSESSTTEGFGLTFIDKIGDWRQDTISIIIPNRRTVLTGKKETKADDKRFLDITDEDAGLAAKPAGCTSTATQDDFFKLRKKMAGEKEAQAMIEEARKEFRSKCFTNEQIRNLGNLFFNEAGKFQFYEVAYPISNDQTGFAVLVAEFRDPYFVHRFKNLVK